MEDLPFPSLDGLGGGTANADNFEDWLPRVQIVHSFQHPGQQDAAPPAPLFGRSFSPVSFGIGHGGVFPGSMFSHLRKTSMDETSFAAPPPPPSSSSSSSSGTLLGGLSSKISSWLSNNDQASQSTLPPPMGSMPPPHSSSSSSSSSSQYFKPTAQLGSPSLSSSSSASSYLPSSWAGAHETAAAAASAPGGAGLGSSSSSSGSVSGSGSSSTNNSMGVGAGAGAAVSAGGLGMKRDLASMLQATGKPFMVGAAKPSAPPPPPPPSQRSLAGSAAGKRTRGGAAAAVADAASAQDEQESSGVGGGAVNSRKRRKVEGASDEAADGTTSNASAADIAAATTTAAADKANATNFVRQAQLKELQKRLDEVGKENDALKAQVKALTIALYPDPAAREPERQKQLNDILALAKAPGTSDLALRSAILAYKNDHADYGKSRWAALKLHLRCLKQLLAPTQLTRLVLWTLAQEDAEAASHNNNSNSSSSSSSSSPSSFSNAIWQSLADQCGLTADQKARVLAMKSSMRERRVEFAETLALLKVFEDKVLSNAQALDFTFSLLFAHLNPSSVAKFLELGENASDLFSVSPTLAQWPAPGAGGGGGAGGAGSNASGGAATSSAAASGKGKGKGGGAKGRASTDNKKGAVSNGAKRGGQKVTSDAMHEEEPEQPDDEDDDDEQDSEEEEEEASDMPGGARRKAGGKDVSAALAARLSQPKIKRSRKESSGDIAVSNIIARSAAVPSGSAPGSSSSSSSSHGQHYQQPSGNSQESQQPGLLQLLSARFPSLSSFFSDKSGGKAAEGNEVDEEETAPRGRGAPQAAGRGKATRGGSATARGGRANTAASARSGGAGALGPSQTASSSMSYGDALVNSYYNDSAPTKAPVPPAARSAGHTSSTLPAPAHSSSSSSSSFVGFSSMMNMGGVGFSIPSFSPSAAAHGVISYLLDQEEDEYEDEEEGTAI